jgi:hypothetical protein
MPVPRSTRRCADLSGDATPASKRRILICPRKLGRYRTDATPEPSCRSCAGSLPVSGRGRPDGEGAIHPHGRPLPVVPPAGDACRCGCCLVGSGNPIPALAILVAATPVLSSLPPSRLHRRRLARRKEGVLMKGSATLEALARVRMAVFDKTGTLTEGAAPFNRDRNCTGDQRRCSPSLSWSRRPIRPFRRGIACRTRPAASAVPTDGVREYRGAGLEGLIDGLCIRAGSGRGDVCGCLRVPDSSSRCLVRRQLTLA